MRLYGTPFCITTCAFAVDTHGIYARPDHNRCAVVFGALYMVLLKDTGIR